MKSWCRYEIFLMLSAFLMINCVPIFARESQNSKDASTRVESKSSSSAQGNIPIVSGHGKITIFGFTQIHYYHKLGDKEESTFLCKRTRLGAKGPINDYASIKMMVELTGSPNLLDAALIFSPLRNLSLSFGQFKPPFGTEFLISAPAHPFIDFSRGKKIGTDRDIGASVTFKKKMHKDCDFELSTGLFNGSGKNTSDTNKYKNFMGRAEFTFAGMLTLAPNAIIGKTNEAAPDKEDLKIYGASLTWKWNREILEGEYIQSNTGEEQKAGWYIWGGHSFSTDWKFMPSIQCLGRYEEYDADTDTAGDKLNRTTIGVNFFIDDKFTKIQVNYQINGEEENSIDNDEIAVNLQLMF